MLPPSLILRLARRLHAPGPARPERYPSRATPGGLSKTDWRWWAMPAAASAWRGPRTCR